uniref:BMA-PSTK-1 n=1 Tax=Brugia malayi TaxID=6279 RepID=A0A7I4KPK5_BRUMA
MALVLLMGIPGSGKTYLCRKLKEKFGDEICATFSYDDIFNDDGFMKYIWGSEYTDKIVVVDVPLTIALERNMQRPMKRRISEDTIRKINQQMELPSNDDSSFIIYQSTNDLQPLVEHIDRIRWKKNLWIISNNIRSKISKENDEISKDGKWMKLELDLRKCISELIREKKIGKNGDVLAKIKKNLYWRIRTKDVINWDMEELKNILWKEYQES